MTADLPEQLTRFLAAVQPQRLPLALRVVERGLRAGTGVDPQWLKSIQDYFEDSAFFGLWEERDFRSQRCAGLRRLWIRLWRQHVFDAGENPLEACLFPAGLATQSLAMGCKHAFTPQSLAALMAFCVAVDAHHAGRFRVLFPAVESVHGTNRGCLLWAEITAVPKRHLDTGVLDAHWGGSGPPALIVAPWSCIVPDATELEGSGEDAFAELGASLPHALRAAAGRGSSPIEDTTFVVALQPLDESDGLSHETTAGLTPRGLEVCGPSLGLSIAICAWAAQQRRSLRPVIASGCIAPSGQVEGVGGIAAKLEAIAGFLEAREDRNQWTILLPEKSHAAVAAGAGVVVTWIDSLIATFQEGFLTDGFDDYRRRLGVVSSVLPTPDVWSPHADWPQEAAPAGRSPGGPLPTSDQSAASAVGLATPRYTAADRMAAEILAQEIGDSLAGESGGAGGWFASTCVPFQADPREFALHVARCLRDRWWKLQGNHVQQPVVLPLSWQLLADADATTPELFWTQFAECCAADLRTSFQIAHPDANALGMALRCDRKLLYLLYDDCSQDVWDNVVSGEGRFRRLAAGIRRLRASDGVHQPQMVLMVCCDAHRQDWLHSLCGPAGHLRTSPAKGPASRFTFLSGHVVRELAEADQRSSDVLAVDHLLDAQRQRAVNADARQECSPRVNRQAFFYGDAERQPLYIPVRVQVAAGCLLHATDISHFRRQAAGRGSARTNAYASLSDLLWAMHQSRTSDSSPDHRGVVLSARSGAGKTVACRKAFHDCVYAPDPERASPDPRHGEVGGSSQVALPGFVPCWIALTGIRQFRSDPQIVERLILRAHNPHLSQHQLDAQLAAMDYWLSCGPPLLLFFDLNSASAEEQPWLAAQLLGFQRRWGGAGHRCVVTCRSASKGAPAVATLGSDNSTFGFYDLSPLEPEEACQYLQEWRDAVGLPPLPAPSRIHWHPVDQIEGLVHVAANLIRTPLLMHFVASLADPVTHTSLALLYAQVVRMYLDREKCTHCDRWNRLGAGPEGLVLTCMTRLALAILSNGPAATSLDLAEARSLLTSPDRDRTSYDLHAYVPRTANQDWSKHSLWSKGDYFTRALRDDEVQAVLELSLLRCDGNESTSGAAVRFVHDSFVHYFAGAVALIDYLRPGKATCLDEPWRQAVVERLFAAAEQWEWPTQFLSSALKGKRHKGIPVRHQLLRDLILACEQVEHVQLIMRFVHGALDGDESLFQYVERALQWHPGFLQDFPSMIVAEVSNYLRTGPQHRVSALFAESLETCDGRER